MGCKFHLQPFMQVLQIYLLGILIKELIQKNQVEFEKVRDDCRQGGGEAVRNEKAIKTKAEGTEFKTRCPGRFFVAIPFNLAKNSIKIVSMNDYYPTQPHSDFHILYIGMIVMANVSHNGYLACVRLSK